MPYIAEDARTRLDAAAQPLLDELRTNTPTEGELNYLVCTLVKGYIASHGESYATFNAAIGALTCARLEIYRRLIAPYEDRKIELNGDVF